MPVFLDRGQLEPRLFVATVQERPRQPTDATPLDSNAIEIGLVNNMPDLALEQTERQILKLLNAASLDFVVILKLYALADVPRNELGKRHLNRLHYRDVSELQKSKLDGLIITGTEPKAENLKHEPYWNSLTELFDWADNNTISTVASCLAVHAAVLHFDGVPRRLLEQKCFGIFDFDRISSNRLFDELPSRFRMPHSRWNGLDENDLEAAGYEVLASSKMAGVDTFVKTRNSFFVFLQGHPEYEAWTLFGEYRRDVGRFLEGIQSAYPDMPSGYFDKDTIQRLHEFKARAMGKHHKDLMAGFPTKNLMQTWAHTAITLYNNWLLHIADCKRSSSKVTGPVAVETANMSG